MGTKISDLPDSTIVAILKHLQPSHVQPSSLVCRNWSQLVAVSSHDTQDVHTSVDAALDVWQQRASVLFLKFFPRTRSCSMEFCAKHRTSVQPYLDALDQLPLLQVLSLQQLAPSRSPSLPGLGCLTSLVGLTSLHLNAYEAPGTRDLEAMSALRQLRQLQVLPVPLCSRHGAGSCQAPSYAPSVGLRYVNQVAAIAHITSLECLGLLLLPRLEPDPDCQEGGVADARGALVAFTALTRLRQLELFNPPASRGSPPWQIPTHWLQPQELLALMAALPDLKPPAAVYTAALTLQVPTAVPTLEELQVQEPLPAAPQPAATAPLPMGARGTGASSHAPGDAPQDAPGHSSQLLAAAWPTDDSSHPSADASTSRQAPMSAGVISHALSRCSSFASCNGGEAAALDGGSQGPGGQGLRPEEPGEMVVTAGGDVWLPRHAAQMPVLEAVPPGQAVQAPSLEAVQGPAVPAPSMGMGVEAAESVPAMMRNLRPLVLRAVRMTTDQLQELPASSLGQLAAVTRLRLDERLEEDGPPFTRWHLGWLEAHLPGLEALELNMDPRGSEDERPMPLSALSVLRSLRSVALHNHKTSWAPIEADDVRALCKACTGLTSLQLLNLHGQMLPTATRRQALQPLRSFTSLTSLALSWSGVYLGQDHYSEGVVDLGFLPPSLTRLWLDTAIIWDSASTDSVQKPCRSQEAGARKGLHRGNLAGLQKVLLSKCKVEGPTTLQRMLRQASLLRVLHLEGLSGMTDASLADIAQRGSLECLHFTSRSPAITLCALRHLTTLSRLHRLVWGSADVIAQAPFNPKLMVLSSLHALRVLGIQDSTGRMLRHAGLHSLADALPFCGLAIAQ